MWSIERLFYLLPTTAVSLPNDSNTYLVSKAVQTRYGAVPVAPGWSISNPERQNPCLPIGPNGQSSFNY